jgi:hypothetical protein
VVSRLRGSDVNVGFSQNEGKQQRDGLQKRRSKRDYFALKTWARRVSLKTPISLNRSRNSSSVFLALLVALKERDEIKARRFRRDRFAVKTARFAQNADRFQQIAQLLVGFGAF